MLITAIKDKKYSIEAYLELEEKSTEKHEYFKGNITTMPGGTVNHSLISTNILTALHIALENKAFSYYVLNSDMKVFIPKMRQFVYPDAIVVSEKPELYEGRRDVIINPQVIVEVLSPATIQYDKGLKFGSYKTISSFKEYILIDQNQCNVTIFTKSNSTLWEEVNIQDMNQSLKIRSLDLEIPLERIYRQVDFI